MNSFTSAICFLFKPMATTEIYTLSLHDALPICSSDELQRQLIRGWARAAREIAPEDNASAIEDWRARRDRKSTRLNSSHEWISYAVFCLKKKTRPRWSHDGNRIAFLYIEGAGSG